MLLLPVFLDQSGESLEIKYRKKKKLFLTKKSIFVD
jgi:hypothetical protein